MKNNETDNQKNDGHIENAQPETNAVRVNNTPQLCVYLETNDINPLNAGEYRFTYSPSTSVVDQVILFASNIRGDATSVWLHHNPNQTYVLNNRATLIAPLQQRGIKVLLGLLGDWTGVGFANLTPAMVESFAQQVATAVNANNLDGVDFDDEYAGYQDAPAGLPAPSAAIYGSLIQRVKQLLPTKLVTAFKFGYANGFDATALNALNYMWPDFGCNATPPTGLPNNKWAKLSIHIRSQTLTIPSQPLIQTCSANYTGYGAVMMFNLREWDASSRMNWFAPNVWGVNKTVSWTGVSHPKNY